MNFCRKYSFRKAPNNQENFLWKLENCIALFRVLQRKLILSYYNNNLDIQEIHSNFKKRKLKKL